MCGVALRSAALDLLFLILAGRGVRNDRSSSLGRFCDTMNARTVGSTQIDLARTAMH